MGLLHSECHKQIVKVLTKQDQVKMPPTLRQRWDQDKGCELQVDWPDSASTPGSQDLSHVMGSSGMITGGAGGQEITLTINNSSLTQAFASASCSSGAAANPQEITLTISGVYILYIKKLLKDSPSLFWHIHRQVSSVSCMIIHLHWGDGGKQRSLMRVSVDCQLCGPVWTESHPIWTLPLNSVHSQT